MKQPISIPEELTELTDDALNKLSDDIKSAAEDLAEAASGDDATLAEMERMVAQFEKVKEEKAAREQRKVERQERTAAALNKFAGDGDDDEEAPAEDAPVAEEAPELIAAAEEAPETAVTEPAAEVTAPEAATAATESAEVASTEAPAPITPEAAVSDTTTTAALDAATASALAPREDAPTDKAAALVAGLGVPGKREGESLDRSTLARAITSKVHGLGPVPSGHREKVTLATATTSYDFKVGNSEEANFAVFENARKAFIEQKKEDIGLVAAGGVCAPLEQNYDFFRMAEEMNPVEATIPVVEAPRGGIRFITAPDFRAGAAGIRITTEAEDAAGYTTLDPAGPTAPKPCIRVDCPPVEECRVDAVSQCVTFGNLNYRVFPEQVEAFLADLAVLFTETKEVFYLDAIDAASTDVTFSPAYSATRGITYTLLAAATNYRRRHHMSPEAPLTLMLPSWVVEFLKVDLINDHSMGLGFIGAGAADVAAIFASMNLDINFYYDSATGAGQAFNGAQAAGVLNPFPSSVVGYLFAPGTFVRLNGGTLDVGLYRDSVLNSTNDLQLFSEEWLQVCMVGIESLRLEISLCPDGTAPEAVVPLECLAGSV